MPISSHYPPIEVPDVDVWSFIFSEIQAGFPPEQGQYLFLISPVESLTEVMKKCYSMLKPMSG